MGRQPIPRKQKAVSVSQHAGQASTAVVLTAVAAAAIGWLWWRRKKDQEQADAGKSQTRKVTGGRSRFSFGRAVQNNQDASSTSQVAMVFQPAHEAAARAGGRRVNSKKDKAHRRQKKEDKAAKKAGQAADELLKSKGIGKDDEGPVTYKYVDMNKTADIYDKVRQYQETGKKTF